MSHPNRINFTDNEIRLLDSLVSAEHTFPIESYIEKASTLQMLRGKARVALVHVEERERGEVPAPATPAMSTAEIMETIDELRSYIEAGRLALRSAERQFNELITPLAVALQRWRDGKATAAADAADNALIVDIDAFVVHCDKLVTSAARPV